MVDISSDNRTEVDRYFHFKRKEDINAFIVHETTPSPRFKAKDYIDYSSSNVEHNSISHLNTHKLSIETSAMLEFQNDDFIYDIKYRLVWRIESISIADDGQMKELSLRPRKKTILNLVR